MASTYERFWRDVDRSGGPDACWPWRGETDARGVGIFRVRGRRTTARRYAYRTEYGDPGPLRVGQRASCVAEECCNPRHTRVRTARDVATGNGSAATRHAGVSCCPRGHVLTPDNTYVRPVSGQRECRLCKAARTAASRRSRRVRTLPDLREDTPGHCVTGDSQAA